MPASRPPRSKPRALSKDELGQAAIRIAARLKRHLDAVDQRELGAEEDLASVLRTLVGSGNGNDVLARLRKRFDLDPAQVTIAGDLVTPARGDVTIISLGRVPMDDTFFPRQNPGVAPMEDIALTRWLTGRCLWLGSAARQSTTWGQLITDYGNTYGSHVGKTVPEVLDTMKMFEAATISLGTYLLRQAGWAIEQALSTALTEAGLDATPVNRPGHIDGIAIAGLRIGSPAAEPSKMYVDQILCGYPGMPMVRALKIPIMQGHSAVIYVDGDNNIDSQVVDADGNIGPRTRVPQRFSTRVPPP